MELYFRVVLLQIKRTGAQRALIVALLILLSFCAVAPARADKPSEPDLSAAGAILVDLDTGQVLYEKNADTPFYPASTTKIMTALLALERGKLDDVITCGESVRNVDGSRIYLEVGEQETLRDLLYAMMLSSANDAAVAIAEHYGGTVERFVALMNAKAAELGATNTHFVTPNGLHNPAHVTTARDLAVIARAAMQNPVFAQIVSTREHDMPWPVKNSTRQLYNINDLLYSFDGAIGVKTGYTTQAHHTLVGAAARNGMRLLSVTLRSDLSHRFADARALLTWGFEHFRPQVVVERGANVGALTVRTQRIPLVTVDRVTYDAAGDPPGLETKLVLSQRTGLPKRGQIVGRLDLLADGQVITSVPVAAAADARAVPRWAYLVAGGLLGSGWQVRQLAMRRRRRRLFAKRGCKRVR